MPDPIFDDRRLAEIYDPLDPAAGWHRIKTNMSQPQLSGSA